MQQDVIVIGIYNSYSKKEIYFMLLKFIFATTFLFEIQ